MIRGEAKGLSHCCCLFSVFSFAKRDRPQFIRFYEAKKFTPRYFFTRAILLIKF
jgi:hypothetical protein